MAESFEQEALLRVAGDDGWLAGLAAEAETVAVVHAEATLERLALRAVALVAVLGEDRADATLEEVEFA